MSHKNRTRRWCDRWERMTYQHMRKRRCDLPRRWMKFYSCLRKAGYWADRAKQYGVENALQHRRLMERHIS